MGTTFRKYWCIMFGKGASPTSPSTGFFFPGNGSPNENWWMVWLRLNSCDLNGLRSWINRPPAKNDFPGAKCTLPATLLTST